MTPRTLMQPSSALSGTFSHPFGTGEGLAAPSPSPVAQQWEKVADRPDEGSSKARGNSCS